MQTACCLQQKVIAALSAALVASASAAPQLLVPGQPIVPGLLENLAQRVVLTSGANLPENNPCLANANTEAERQLCITQAEFAARAALPTGVLPNGVVIGASGAVGAVAPGITNLQL